MVMFLVLWVWVAGVLAVVEVGKGKVFDGEREVSCVDGWCGLWWGVSEWDGPKKKMKLLGSHLGEVYKDSEL